MSTAIIAGIDEAGRGCIAGPVVAAACVYDWCCPERSRRTHHDTHPLITDSKILTKKQREEAFTFLTENFPFGVGIVDAQFIDSEGILAATEKAMQEAVAELSQETKPTYLIIDGRDHFWFDISHSSVIRGDQSEPCIAAASIIAKVTRDSLMCEYEEEFPEYGFGKHKGYGTEIHFQKLRKFGVSPLHRRTFLRNL